MLKTWLRSLSSEFGLLFATCLIVFGLLVSFGALEAREQRTDSLVQAENSLDLETLLKKEVRAIAESLSTHPVAKDLFVINNAMVNTPRNSTGRGIHYTITITQFTDALAAEEDAATITGVVALLLERTTEKILVKNEDIQYVAVLLIHPTLWPQGFANDVQGHAYFYVAKRDKLVALLKVTDMEVNWLNWLKTAERGMMNLVDSIILRDLMDAASNKNKGEDGGGFIRP